MKEDQFVKRLEPLMEKYPDEVAGKPVRGVKRFLRRSFPKDYRQLTHLLAMARARHYSTGTRQALEKVVLAGHRTLYSGNAGGFSPGRFIRYEFPQCVRANGKLVTLSSALFFLPLMILPVIIHFYPSVAYMIIPGDQLAEMSEAFLEHDKFTEERTAADDVQMWAFYVMNNIGVDLRTFAWGALCGIGSIFFMLYNGVVIGTVTGHVINIGAADHFFEFVCTHGAPELIGAVLSGAAGMKMGFALLCPGRLSRGRAFTAAAGDAFRLLAGAVILTFLAAFVEAFWSPNPLIPAWVKFSVAAVFWMSLGVYFLRAGKVR